MGSSHAWRPAGRRARSPIRARLLATVAGVALLGGMVAITPAAAATAPPPGPGPAGPGPAKPGGPGPHPPQGPQGPQACTPIPKHLPNLRDWPKVPSRFRKDPADEKRIDELLKKMTLEEKVGQMIQPEISAITPEEVKQYNIGSVLNGGGSWPGPEQARLAADWLALADAFCEASIEHPR